MENRTSMQSPTFSPPATSPNPAPSGPLRITLLPATISYRTPYLSDLPPRAHPLRPGNQWKNMDFLPAYLGICYQHRCQKARICFHKQFTARLLRLKAWRRGESNPCP